MGFEATLLTKNGVKTSQFLPNTTKPLKIIQ